METPAKGVPRLKKLTGWIAFVAATLVTLIALFYAEEDWRGAHAWNNYKREMETKGESFDPIRLIPPVVPDDQNLAMIPFFAKSEPVKIANKFTPPHRTVWRYGWAPDFTNWSAQIGMPTTDPVQGASNVLNELNQNEPLIAELSAARERPSYRLNINYLNWWPDTNTQSDLMPRLAQVKSFFRVMSLRAQAELVIGQSDRALEDIELMFRVNDGVCNEPLLISQMVAHAEFASLLRPVAEGLAEHRWSEAQLRILQARLQNVDLLASAFRSIHGERDLCYRSADLLGGLPRGWTDLERLNICRAIQDTIVPRIDLTARRIDPLLLVLRSFNSAVERLSANPLLHHTILAALILPALQHIIVQSVQTQAEIDEARFACALERFRLAEGHYPETSDALVPRFEAQLPRDIASSQPLKYRRIDDERFILYGFGMDGADHGETISPDRVFEYPRAEQILLDDQQADYWKQRNKQQARKVIQREKSGR